MGFVGVEDITISTTNKSKVVTKNLLMMTLVHQDLLDQELGEILLDIAHIQV